MRFEGSGHISEKILDESGREETVSLILNEAEQRPKPTDFADLYGEEVVGADDAYATRLKADFERKNAGNKHMERGQRFSEAFERLFKSWAPRLGWFGEGAAIANTSEYDDYVNGVDGVLILPSKDYVALAIDTTHAGGEKIEDKLLRATDRVTGKADKAPVLKYFKHKNIKGRLEGVIPCVVGLDNENANGIIDTLGQVFRLLKNKNRDAKLNQVLSEKVEKLKEHPGQLVFLKEIEMQLNMYRHLVAKDPEIAHVSLEGIELILDIIKGLISERSHIELGDLEDDRVMGTIKAFTLSQKL